MISESDAIDQAKKWVTKVGASFEGRQVVVSLTGGEVYTIVFPLPANHRGGDFTIRVDAQTGEVLEGVIER